MISIWLCPTHEDELYLQKIINKLSENYNSPIFLPHCTLLGGVKLNEFDLENIIDISIENIGLIKIKSNGIDYTNIIWKTVFIKLVILVYILIFIPTKNFDLKLSKNVWVLDSSELLTNKSYLLDLGLIPKGSSTPSHISRACAKFGFAV